MRAASQNPRFAPRFTRHAGAAAFSLAELLITLVLMLIIFVMLFSFSSKSHQHRQKQACKENLQKIYVALELFANETGGTFPAVAGAKTSDAVLGTLVPQYISLREPFTCPGSKDTPIAEGEPVLGKRISYAYYMGRKITDATEPLLTDEQIDSGPKVQGQPLFSQNGKRPGNNHHKYGGNVLACDGNVESGGAIAKTSLLLTQGVALLNPRDP